MIQILCNLIQNAVDASSPLSDIGITTSLTDRTLTITVVDKGMGISPDVLPHIFDPFFTTKYGAQSVGLGLGLAISKNLLSSMGGQLDCSTKEGKGTTFSIILPLPLNIHKHSSILSFMLTDDFSFTLPLLEMETLDEHHLRPDPSCRR